MPPENIKLLADAMLGRLARWLRILGYDTLYEADTEDTELLRRARAEDRILLTADRALSARRGARTLLITAEDLASQIRQVQEELGPSSGGELSRCVACNGRLEPVSPSAIADRVPPYVLATQDRFYRCPDCGRVYWPGTHVAHMHAMMDDEWSDERHQ